MLRFDSHGVRCCHVLIGFAATMVYLEREPYAAYSYFMPSCTADAGTAHLHVPAESRERASRRCGRAEGEAFARPQ